MNYEELMKLALNEARKGINIGEQPYGCVLLDGESIVSVAHNEVISTNDQSNHSEIVAINNYIKTNPNKSNNLTLVSTCEPCMKCFAYAINVGVKRFVFGTSIETAAEYGSGDIPLSIRGFKQSFDFEVISDVLKTECDKMLEIFYLRKNIVRYSEGTDEEIYWMQKALEIGRKGMVEKDELPIGVILVAGDKVLSETCTLTYTLNSPITHGDFMALYNAQREVYSENCKRPLVLYSTLEPHILGFGAAIKCKVDKVVFGLEAGPDGGSCYLPGMIGIKERIPQTIGGVCRDEQYELMSEFLRTHEEGRVGYGYARQLVKLYEKERNGI